jgi:glutaconate CoA-transferase, subunit A
VTKRSTLAEAVARWVPDGSSVVMCAALEALIPFAAGHEIMRQGKRDLTLIAPISDVLFDQLIGAGCARKVAAAWVGNVSEGLGHNYRRATEQSIPHRLEVEEHSNLSISLALLAAGLGAPYLPMRSLLGTDILQRSPTMREDRSPFGGEPIVLVPALTPDVAILHVQRADDRGYAHAWGNLGVSRDALMAARHAIIVAEEIVPHDLITSDPNRVLGAAGRVVAVVEEPGGAHPSPVQGYYNRDHDFFHEYHTGTRTVEGWHEWQRAWITGIPDRAEYLRALGADRWASLQRKTHRYAAPVDYGY